MLQKVPVALEQVQDPSFLQAGSLLSVLVVMSYLIDSRRIRYLIIQWLCRLWGCCLHQISWSYSLAAKRKWMKVLPSDLRGCP